MGKTTLANIVARQAGYAVVELNASDSRNVPDFEKALEGAVRTSRTITQVTAVVISAILKFAVSKLCLEG